MGLWPPSCPSGQVREVMEVGMVPGGEVMTPDTGQARRMGAGHTQDSPPRVQEVCVKCEGCVLTPTGISRRE